MYKARTIIDVKCDGGIKLAGSRTYVPCREMASVTAPTQELAARNLRARGWIIKITSNECFCPSCATRREKHADKVKRRFDEF